MYPPVKIGWIRISVTFFLRIKKNILSIINFTIKFCQKIFFNNNIAIMIQYFEKFDLNTALV